MTVTAITLFVDDLAKTEAFYSALLDAEPVHREHDSVVFRAGEMLVNCLHDSGVHELITPEKRAASGATAVYSLRVPDLAIELARLADAGLAPSAGPQDRSWGIRSANFTDPAGHIWEIAVPLTVPPTT